MISHKLYFESQYSMDIIDQLACEKEAVGYYNLPYQDTSYVAEYLAQLPLDEIEVLVVVGIGGSSLGIRAVYHFIKASRTLPRKLYFMGSTDPLSITNTLNKVNIKKAHFIVISKSGTTIETIATYKYLLDFIPKNQFSFITDAGSKLDMHARENKQIVCNIQPNIGGRFSVFSIVGIIPLALVGIDYLELLTGARKVSDAFWQKQNSDIVKKAYFLAKHQHIYNINTIFSYSDSLNYFNDWFVQLWGESLGKKQEHSELNVGPTPIGLIGPKDQHSFLQLIADGTRDKTVSFITIANNTQSVSVPNISLTHLEELDMLNGLSFTEIINNQSHSTMKALQQMGDIPLEEIILHGQDEHTIGELLFYYQLLTSLVGKLLAINTYNQPGVELGKQILKDTLR